MHCFTSLQLQQILYHVTQKKKVEGLVEKLFIALLLANPLPPLQTQKIHYCIYKRLQLNPGN